MVTIRLESSKRKPKIFTGNSRKIFPDSFTTNTQNLKQKKEANLEWRGQAYVIQYKNNK